MLISWIAAAIAFSSGPDRSDGVELFVRHPPQVVVTDGRPTAVYELGVTNLHAAPVFLVELEVRQAGALRLRLDGESLETAVMDLAARETTTEIPPGETRTLYLQADDPDGGELQHRLRLTGPDGDPITLDWTGPAPSPRTAPVFGPPVAGGPWVAVYAPDLPRSHRRVLVAMDGDVRVPGRFAIDWMRPGRNALVGEHEPVLAVADGAVVLVADGRPDSQGDPGRIPLREGPGNFVSLEVSKDRYVVYEHLRAGLCVAPGERVRRGQVLGYVGRSGHAMRAHLHMHLADHPDPLRGEGLPFALEAAPVARFASLEDMADGEPRAVESGMSFPAEFPPALGVYRFAAAAEPEGGCPSGLTGPS